MATQYIYKIKYTKVTNGIFEIENFNSEPNNNLNQVYEDAQIINVNIGARLLDWLIVDRYTLERYVYQINGGIENEIREYRFCI